MPDHCIPLGHLIIALIHPARPWVRSAPTAAGVGVYLRTWK